MILTARERSFFMQGVAAYMAANHLPNQISAEQLDELIERLCEAIPAEVSTGPPPGPALAEPLRHRIKRSLHGMDSVKTDVRSCGLLAMDLSKSGAFRFAHKSFMEYLVARVLAHDDPGGEIPEDNAGYSEICEATKLDLAHLGFYPESLAFFSELVRNSEYSYLVLDRTTLEFMEKEQYYLEMTTIGDILFIIAKRSYAHRRTNPPRLQVSRVIPLWTSLFILDWICTALPRLSGSTDMSTFIVREITRWRLLYPCSRAIGLPEEKFDFFFRHDQRILRFLKSSPHCPPGSTRSSPDVK
jgi:hypothetical protein